MTVNVELELQIMSEEVEGDQIYFQMLVLEQI